MAYARLDAMRSDANAMLEGRARPGQGGHVPVPDRAGRHRPDQPGPAGAAGHRGPGPDLRPDRPAARRLPTARRRAPRRFHIGRLAIHSADHDPLVVDWRAPIAEPFYRATGRDPQGLVLRRHLALEGRKVVGLEDERFTDPGSRTDTDGRHRRRRRPRDAGGELIVSDLPIGGPAALLAALDRARSGRMTDIVSTIQREQDEIIRAPLTGVLVVQGGPGNGQDRGGPAPGGLPPLHPPLPPRAPGRPGGRAQPLVPPVHRTGAALAGRDRGHPVHRVGPGAGDPDQGQRPGRRGPAEGRRPHGQGGGPRRADPPARPGRRRGRPLRRPPAAADPRGQRPDRGHGAPPARDPQRPPAPGRAVRGPAAGRPGPPDPADPGRRGPGLGHGLPRLRGPVRSGR